MGGVFAVVLVLQSLVLQGSPVEASLAEGMQVHDAIADLINRVWILVICPTVGCSSPPWEVLFPAP